jgi:hypothetical protein
MRSRSRLWSAPSSTGWRSEWVSQKNSDYDPDAKHPLI